MDGRNIKLEHHKLGEASVKTAKDTTHNLDLNLPGLLQALGGLVLVFIFLGVGFSDNLLVVDLILILYLVCWFGTILVNLKGDLRRILLKRHFLQILIIFFLLVFWMGVMWVYRQERLNNAVIQKQEQAIDFLLACGVDINSFDHDGKTALTKAIWCGDLQLVSKLLSKGAETNTKNRDRETPLIVATKMFHKRVMPRKGDLRILKTLCANGADVNAKDNLGITALMWAAICGSPTVNQVLIEQGADVNAQNKEGVTALIYAAGFGEDEIVRILLANKANINASTNQEWTALMNAAKYNHPNAVRILLENGCDVKVRNKNGQTALDIAIQEGHGEIIDLLKGYSSKDSIR